ncbi:hypothetical protein Tco_0848831 [Tanacetum coccineum]
MHLEEIHVNMGSFGEETDEITDLHQILEEVLLTKRGDGVAGIKRRRHDPSGAGVRRFSDGVRTCVTFGITLYNLGRQTLALVAAS